MADRAQYQLQVRVVKGGPEPRIIRDTYKAKAGTAFPVGTLLSVNTGGRVFPIDSPYDDTNTNPLRFIALESYDGVGTNTVIAVQEIDRDTVLEIQTNGDNAATVADIHKRGVLVKGTNGNWAVVITDEDPAVEIIDVEPNFNPAGVNATGKYNKLWVKVLASVLEKAPQAAA